MTALALLSTPAPTVRPKWTQDREGNWSLQLFERDSAGDRNILAVALNLANSRKEQTNAQDHARR